MAEKTPSGKDKDQAEPEIEVIEEEIPGGAEGGQVKEDKPSATD